MGTEHALWPAILLSHIILILSQPVLDPIVILMSLVWLDQVSNPQAPDSNSRSSDSAISQVGRWALYSFSHLDWCSWNEQLGVNSVGGRDESIPGVYSSWTLGTDSSVHFTRQQSESKVVWRHGVSFIDLLRKKLLSRRIILIACLQDAFSSILFLGWADIDIGWSAGMTLTVL